VRARAGRTIKRDLLVVLPLAVVLPSVLILGIFTYNVRRIIDTDVVAYQEVIINQERDSLENIFSSVNVIQRSIIGKIITDYTPPDIGAKLSKADVEKLKELIEYLYTVAQAYKFVNGVYVVYESGYVISSRNSIRPALLREQFWVDIARQSNGEEIIVKPHPAAYNVGIERNDYDEVITSIQKFFLPDVRKHPILVQIDIDKSAFDRFIHSMSYDEQIPMYIYNAFTNSVLIENEIHASYSKRKLRNEIAVSKELKTDLLYLKAFIPRDRMLLKFRTAIVGTLAIISVIVVLSVFMVILFSGLITRPLQDLYKCMQRVGSGDFFPDYPTTRYQEINFLINRFRTMVAEVNELIATVVLKENEASEAELQALQAKINPHFLYNTLDVIRSIALEHDNQDISDMTLSLSRLFRYNVGNLQETTTIAEELRYLKDYLKIQSYRFGNRNKVDIGVPKELHGAVITRFILQPIVENAFKYGLELRGKGGVLKIAAERAGGDLLLSVRNNGPAIPEDKLAALRASFDIEPTIGRVKSAHGLDNVNLRLKLLYGRSYGLGIDDQDGQWTVITVRVPFIEGDAHV
jgi:sensor histidine kinase YesM